MTSTYNKINRLKAQGWTWEEFLRQLDEVSPAQIDLKTLKANAKDPHREPNGQLISSINLLHDNIFPSPYPKESEAFMSLYNHLHSSQAANSAVYSFAEILRVRISSIQDPLSILKARLIWLEGNIQYDRISSLRDQAKGQEVEQSREQAIRYYYQACEILNHNREELPYPYGLTEEYKLLNNIIGCNLNAIPPLQRSKDKQLHKLISDSNILLLSQELLDKEPFQWQVARNALRFSSLQQNKEAVIMFYERLAKSSKRFDNIHYEPAGYPSIAESQDFTFARQVIKDTFHS